LREYKTATEHDPPTSSFLRSEVGDLFPACRDVTHDWKGTIR